MRVCVCVCLCVLCSTHRAHRKCQSNRLKNKIWRPTNEQDSRKAWNFKYILASRIFIPMNKGSDLLWWKVFFSRLRYFLNSTLNNKRHSKHGCADLKMLKNYPNSSVTCLGTKTNTFRLWHSLSRLHSLDSSHDAPTVSTRHVFCWKWTRILKGLKEQKQTSSEVLRPCMTLFVYLVVGAEAQSGQGWNPSWLLPLNYPHYLYFANWHLLAWTYIFEILQVSTKR